MILPILRWQSFKPNTRTRSFLTLIGSFAIFFVSIGYINAFGIFQEYYTENILSDRSASDISWLGSFNVFCLFGGSFGTGILNDMYGPTVCLALEILGRACPLRICTNYSRRFFSASGLPLQYSLCS